MSDLMNDHLVTAGVIKPLDLILLMGLPGAGKSHHVKTLLAADSNACLIHPDGLRLELTGSESNFSKDPFIWGTLIPIRMNGAMALRQPIVFDATMVSKKARKRVIKHAKWLGYRVVVHVVRTPIDECIRRNASRARQVPVDVIERMQAQWQEPETSEDIDEIVEVSQLDA